MSSMESLRLNPNMTRSEIAVALHIIVSQSQLRHSYVAMVCSRGVPKVPGTRDPKDCDNHFFVWCVPYVHVVKSEVVKKGASALIAETIVRIPDHAVNPLVKNYH